MPQNEDKTARGGADPERLYLLDDPELGVARTCLGEGLLIRSAKRYEYAARHVLAGDVVADCACGSGYGSAILKSAGASRVVGIDADAVTVEYARRHYGSDAVTFECQDIGQLVVPAEAFDVFAVIETIEHVTQGKGFLSRVYKALRPGGRAVISTPLALKSGPNAANPYHFHEYTREDFESLLNDVFDSAQFFVPTPDDMPLALTDGHTVGIVFGVGLKA